LLHQVGDLFELYVKLRCQKVKTDGRTGRHGRFSIRHSLWERAKKKI